jgi:hypothetical protein
MANIVVAAIAKWNGSALVKGEKQLTQFQKTTNKLAKSFVTLFAAQKIYAFGKASVKAFAADEKAAKSLAIALENTGNGFATIATENFISRLQDTYKVLDDELRPAFQTLLNTTGSLTTSQRALELALNISAGTGKDLTVVSMALARGYAGQTTGLSRLGAGLDKATLKTGDMDKITGVLAAKFKGQALAATKTYTGQMNALTVATESAKEEIGKGLLDAIALLGGDDGIENATKNMDQFGVSTGNAIYGLATLVKTFQDSPFGKVTGFFSRTSLLGQLSAIGKASRPTAGTGAAYSPTSMYFTMETAERAKLIATIKKGNTAEKEKQKLLAAELAEKKKQAELDALKKKFDVDRINLQTALANSTDEAEKARIRSLLTIMDEDANAAAKRMAQLDAANALKMKADLDATASINKLAEAAKLAAFGIGNMTLGGVPAAQFMATAIGPDGIGNEALARAVEIESQLALMDALNAVEEARGSVGYSDTTNNFTINTPLGTEDALTEAMQRALQNLNRYGSSTTFAGALQVLP